MIVFELVHLHYIIKAFSGMCVRLTSITFPVIWSSVLISVTREWRYCGLVYKFFLINNIELKCSFVRCQKYHKSWSNGAAELHISVDLFCGTTAAELHICVRLTSITFPVIGRACCFSDSRVALLWADL